MASTSLVDTIAQTQVAAGTVMAWWLGGTGFVFKTPAGTQIYVDPYLTNCVAGIFGIERDFPPPIRPAEARPDLVIATHWHEDHLDPEGIPQIAAHSQAEFLAPPSCVSRMAGWGIARPRMTALTAGQSHTFPEVQITAVPARHLAGVPGWETDDAIGLLLDFGGLRIYHSGDTEYDLRLRALAYTQQPPIDIALVVINGAGGNMNAHEAALLAWQLKVKQVIPMHHRLWKDFTGGEQATLDPQLLVDTYQRLGGVGQVTPLAVGEGILLHA
ncbi:MAG: MBL fold metallo-hydrolase [Caldilineaceae bacterium]|nr:MBL fold metallo-hydrolase [Caldilineaceae bacterium]